MERMHHKSIPLIRIEDLVTIHYDTFTPEHVFPGETHDFWEMVYVDKGYIRACNGEDRFIAHEGTLLFHAPNVFHYASGNGESKSNVFIISFTTPSSIMNEFAGRRIMIPPMARRLISNIVYETNRYYSLGTPGLVTLPNAPVGGDQLIRIYLEELLIILYRNVIADSKIAIPSTELTATVIAYLNSKIYDTVTIEDVCRYTNFGKTQLCRRFKEETDKTIMAYYTDIKLNTARGLLKAMPYSIKTLSEMMSFESPEYFAKLFKRKYGMTPTEYRRSLDPS